MIKKKIKSVSYIILSYLIAFITIFSSTTVFASDGSTTTGIPNDATLDFYNANGIYYYNPAGNECVTVAVGAYSGTTSAGLTAEQAGFVDAYHDIAEQLTIEFGIPWEAVMAQGINESAAGTSNFATTRNNFFGINAIDSDPSGHASYFETPAAGWRGYYLFIRENSRYRNNGVFQNNAPISFTIKPNGIAKTIRDNITNPYDYLQTIWDAGYATSESYYPNIAPLITAIINRAKEKGWQTTEELAISHPELLTNAALNASGANITGTGSIGSSGNICTTSGQGNGDINNTAINLSWDDRSHGMTPKPTYETALKYLGLWGGTDNECINLGAACDRFVTTVLRYSGADPNAPIGGAATLVNYLASSDLYEEIENIGNSSNLQPGDILGVVRQNHKTSGHIMIYVQKPDGTFGIASASLCDHSPDLASNYTPRDSISGQPWRIFRLKTSNVEQPDNNNSIGVSSSNDNLNVTIPGLSGSYKIGWVSDTHVAADADKNTDAYKNLNVSGRFGDNTESNWNNIIDRLNSGGYDAVIFGGDLMDYYSENNYNVIKNGLNRLKMPWFYIYGSGDHDKNNDPTGRIHINDDLFSSGSHNSNDMITLGGELTLIGLNGSSRASDIDISGVESKIRSTSNPVILATHVPFDSKDGSIKTQVAASHNNVNYLWTNGSYNNNWEISNISNFVNTFLYNNSNVKLVLAGHVHTLSYTGKLNSEDGAMEHIFKAGYTGNIGTINVKGN